jgi:fructose-specific phosphotransferase system IIC component
VRESRMESLAMMVSMSAWLMGGVLGAMAAVVGGGEVWEGEGW